MKQIRTQVEETTSDYDREKLQERLAKLVGGVAVIKVGAATETEMKEKKARVEDAMHATKAAVEEGIVPGGGVALVRAARCSRPEARGRPADRRQHHHARHRGADALDRHQRRPRGLDRRAEGPRDRTTSPGFNAQTEKYENLVEAGVIDPTKVVRSALQNAVVDRVAAADDRGADLRDPRGEEGSAGAGGPGGGMGGMY